MALPTYHSHLSCNLTSLWGYHQSPYVDINGTFFLLRASPPEVFNTLIHVAGYKILVTTILTLTIVLSQIPNLQHNFPLVFWKGEIAVLFSGKRETLCLSSTTQIIALFCHCSVSFCFIHPPRTLIFISILIYGALHHSCGGWIPNFILYREVCLSSHAFNQLVIWPQWQTWLRSKLWLYSIVLGCAFIIVGNYHCHTMEKSSMSSQRHVNSWPSSQATGLKSKVVSVCCNASLSAVHKIKTYIVCLSWISSVCQWTQPAIMSRSG